MQEVKLLLLQDYLQEEYYGDHKVLKYYLYLVQNFEVLSGHEGKYKRQYHCLQSVILIVVLRLSFRQDICEPINL